MSQPFQDIIHSLNARLKARDVINLIGFRPEGMSRVGTRLKGYCPVHRGETFKSLQIDESSNTCQCIVKECAAYEPVTLVELFALSRGMAPIAAALELAREFKVDLGSEADGAVASHYHSIAMAELKAGKPTEAIANLRIARAALPDDFSIAEELARLVEEHGTAEERRQAWMDVARAQADTDPAGALATIEAYLNPGAESDEGTLDLYSSLLRLTRPEDVRWAEIRRTLAKKRFDRGERAAALAELDELLAILPNDPDVLVLHGEILNEEGRESEAHAAWRQAAKALLKAGRKADAAGLLQRLLNANPDDDVLREKLANLRADLGDLKTFARELVMLARLALNRGDDFRAEELFRAVLERDPVNRESLVGLAEIADSQGDVDTQADCLLRLAEVQFGDPTQRALFDATLNRLLSLEPRDVEQQERLAHLLERAGRRDSAVDVWTRIALLNVVLQEYAVAERQLRHVIELVPEDANRRERVIAELLANDQPRLAAICAVEYARRLEKAGRAAEAAGVLVDALSRCGPLEELEIPSVDLLIQVGDRERLEPVLVSAFDRLIRFNRFADAERLVAKALEAYPGDICFLEKLADVMLMADRMEEGRAVLHEIAASEAAPLDLRIRAIEQALELDIGDYDSMLFLASLHEQQGDAGKAANSYQMAAEILVDEGEMGRARDAMARARELAPDDRRLLLTGATLLLRGGDAPGAESELIAYAHAHRGDGDSRAIEAAWREGIDRLPKGMALRCEYAGWLAEQGRPKEAAVQLLELAGLVRGVASQAELQGLYGQAFQYDPDNYMAVLERARELSAGSATNHDELAPLLEQVWHGAGAQGDESSLLEVGCLMVQHQCLGPARQLRLVRLLKGAERLDEALDRGREFLPTIPESERPILVELLLELGDDSPELHVEFADFLEAAGESVRAAEQLSRAANSLLAMQKNTDASELLQRAYGLTPDDVGLGLELMNMLTALGRWDQATELAPVLSRGLVEAGQPTAPIEFLRPMLVRTPSDPELHLRLAESLRLTGAKSEAVEHYSQASALHEGAGRWRESAAALAPVLELTPDAHSVREHCASLLRRAGDLGGARAEYQQLLKSLVELDDSESLELVLRALEQLEPAAWEPFEEINRWLREAGFGELADESLHRYVQYARAAKEAEAALAGVGVLLEHHPTQVDLLGIRAVLEVQLHRNEEAVQTAVKVAKHAAEQGVVHEAIDAVQEVLDYLPENERLRRSLLELLLADGQTDRAAEIARELIAEWRTMDRFEEAVLLAEVILLATPDAVEFAILKADLQIEDGRGSNAVDGLREFAKEIEDEKPEAAREAFRYLLGQFPDSAEDLASLSALVLRIDGIEAARPLQLKALELLHRQSLSVEDFKQHSAELVESDPGNLALRERHFELLVERNEPNEAASRALSLAAAHAEGGSGADAARLGRLAVDLRPDLETRRALAAILEKASLPLDAAAVWRIIAEKHGERGEQAALAHALREVIRLDPPALESRRLLADLLLADASLAPESEALEFLTETAESLREAADHATAVAYLRAAIPLDQSDPSLRVRLCESLQALGDWDAWAVEVIELVRLHLASDNLEEAGRAAEAALERHATIPLRHEFTKVLLAQGNLPAYAQQLCLIAATHMSESATGEAIETLTTGGETLMRFKSSALVLEVLGRFPDLVGDVPELGRLQAEALEDRGDEVAAALAWVRLSETHLGAGNPGAAAEALGRAVDLQPRKREWRERRVTALRELGPGEEPQLVRDLRQLALLYIADGDHDKAIDLNREILSIHPDDLEALRKLAELHAIAGHDDESREAHLRLAEAFVKQGDPTAAEELFEQLAGDELTRAVALRSLLFLHEETGAKEKHLAAARRLAQHFDKHQLLEDANAIHERIVAHHPGEIPSRERLAEYHLQAGDNELAADQLRELARLYINTGELDKAAEALERVDRLAPDDPETPEVRASLFEKLRDVPGFCANLLLASERHRAAGDADRALAALERLLQEDPYHAEAHEGRAALFMETGQRAAALKEFELLAHVYQSAELPELEARSLEQILTLDDTAHSHRERLAQLLTDQGRDAEAASQLVQIAAWKQAEDDLAGAVDAIEMALTLAPGSVDVQRRALDIYAADEQLDEALATALSLADGACAEGEPERALELLRLHPIVANDPEGQLRIGEVLILLGRNEDAKAILKQALERLENQPASRRKALGWLYQLDPSRRDLYEELFSAAIASGDRSEAVKLALTTADHLLQMGEVDETRDFLSEAAARLPDAMALHRGAAELYKTHALPELAAFELVHEARALRAANDADGALDCATRALELRSNDLGALRLRVDLLLDSDQPGSAMEDALRLIDLLGERDMIAPALDLAERMVVVEPRNIPIRSRLVRLLSLRNDVAAQVVQLRELARLHAEADQMEPAAECLRQLLEFRPDDTRARIAYIEAYRHIGSEADLADDYLALAKAHARTGAIMEANRVFDRAISVAPERHDIHEMYIQFLLKNGDRANAIAKACDLSTLMVDDQQARRAVELLQSLGVKEGVDPRYHECLGRAQLSVNSRGQAMREWRLAASIHLQRGAHDQVARILAEMLAVDPFNLEIRQQLIDAHLNAGQISDALNAQEELALRYMERGLCDLAEVELRKVIALEPQRPDAWRALFKACLTLVDERQLIPDYLEFADLMVSRGEIREAVDYYFKVIELDPRNLRAHRGYVIQYPKIGRHQDIVDTILTYAQLLVENGNVDEGSRYFELVMSIDPGNTMARDMLSATASRAEQELPTAGAAKTGPGKEPRTGRSGLHPIPGFAGVPPNLESSFDDERLTDTQKRFIREKTVSASDYLAGALDQFEKEESAEALAQVVTNYRTILAANAQNAPVRLKLADVLEQMGRMPEMLNELFLASETLFQRGELAQCVQVCERFLSHNPTDQRMRKRLSEAVVKRDAMKALESAISFSDDSEDR